MRASADRPCDIAAANASPLARACSLAMPSCALRVGWERHRWRFFEPIWPDPSLDKEADWKRMTQLVMDRFDHLIRENPDQYFWFNKRWVLGEEK